MKAKNKKTVELGPKQLQIPKDWKYLTFLDVAKNEKNSIIDGPFGSHLKVSEFVNKGVPVIELKHLRSNLSVKNIDRFITNEKLNEIKRSKVQNGDIVISKTGTLGLNAIVPEEFPEAMMTSRLAKISLNQGKAVNIYFKYWLDFLKQKRFWEIKGVGTTMLILNLDIISNAPVILPPLPEQEKIAEVLSTVDEAIEKTDKIIEESKLTKKGLMQDLLTKGIDHSEFKEVELGPKTLEIPKDWNMVSFDGSLDYSGGSQPPKRTFKNKPKEGYIRLYQIRDYTGSSGNPVYIPKEKASKTTKNGDILIGRYGASLGEIFFAEKGAYNVAMVKVEIKDEEINKNYLYYFLKSKLFQDRLSIGVRAAQSGFNKSDWNSFGFIKPPLPEQKEIAEILSSVDQRIKKEKEYKEKLKSLKKGLMQDLLTGKVRVNNLINS